MKAVFLACVLVAALFMFAGEGLCGENGLSLGYGFAAFNRGEATGKLEGDKIVRFHAGEIPLRAALRVEKACPARRALRLLCREPGDRRRPRRRCSSEILPFDRGQWALYRGRVGHGLQHDRLSGAGNAPFFHRAGRYRLPVRQILYRGQVPPLFERWHGGSQLVGQCEHHLGGDIFLTAQGNGLTRR